MSEPTTAEMIEWLDNMSMPEPNSGCVLWLGAVNGDGYGLPSVRGRRIMVHRLAWEATNGSISADHVIDHLCRVRCCINPLHMECVSPVENVMRGHGPTATNARKLTCRNGHELSGDNCRIDRGRRHCRTCDREWMRAYRRRKIAARLRQASGKAEPAPTYDAAPGNLTVLAPKRT